jgi:hypothetical protein
MKEQYDPWYVRLPDGRTIKAKSTASVRHHVEAGHVPLNSLVRRDSNEEWVGLVWVAEFADLKREPSAKVSAGAPAPPGRSGVSARLDPLRLQTVGVRGFIDELFAALDSTLSRSKLVPAFVAAILLYLGMYAARVLLNWLLDPAPWVPMAVGSAFAVLVLSILNAVLSRLTHLELSTMRPARLADALRSFSTYAIPALLANAVIAGSGLGLLFLLNKAPGWTETALKDGGMGDATRTLLYTPVLVIVYLLSALVWLFVGLCWLLTPAIVVEESSWFAGVREWRQLLRDHLSRIVVYEGLTILLGIAISLPLAVAVHLALFGAPTLFPAWPAGTGDGASGVLGPVRAAMHGLAAAPLLALLPVANVFIYLNVRYEQGR